MSIAAAIEEMIAEGFTLDQALKAAKIVEAHLFAPIDNRSAHAKRQERYRERKRHEASQSVTNVTPTEASRRDAKASQSVTNVTPLARVEDNPTTTEISGKKKNNTPKASRGVTPTPREILLECLSPEIADGVLAHRKAKRCPLTVRAAQLLAKGFLATADPNAAADMMIARGWQGFKPEWFDNERAANGQGRRQGKGSIVEAGRRLTERLVAAERERELQAVNRVDDGDPPVRLLPGLGSERP